MKATLLLHASKQLKKRIYLEPVKLDPSRPMLSILILFKMMTAMTLTIMLITTSSPSINMGNHIFLDTMPMNAMITILIPSSLPIQQQIHPQRNPRRSSQNLSSFQNLKSHRSLLPVLCGYLLTKKVNFVLRTESYRDTCSMPPLKWLRQTRKPTQHCPRNHPNPAKPILLNLPITATWHV